MHFPEIKSFSPHYSKKPSLAKQIVSWLGRMCSFCFDSLSFCSSSLMILTNKVKLGTFAFFNQLSSPPSSINPTPQPTSPLAVTPNKILKNEDSIQQTEDKNSETVDLSLSQLPQLIDKEDEVEEEIGQNIDTEAEKKEEIAGLENPSLLAHTNTKTSISAIESENTIPTPIKPSKTELKPIYYDNKGKGNCQLLAILKGLELQYPDVLNDLRKSQDDDLTAQQLRQMGVDFARDQIDSCGEYAESVLSYADADRKEFNLVYINPMKRKHSEQLKKIDEKFKDNKTSKLYEKQIKECKAKHSNELKKLKKATLIYTDEKFLNSLEKNGFYCSTLHLLALSVLLEIPIYVKEQLGVKNHDIQMFNPTESEKEPIHLYRVANRHYQYIFYVKD